MYEEISQEEAEHHGGDEGFGANLSLLSAGALSAESSDERFFASIRATSWALPCRCLAQSLPRWVVPACRPRGSSIQVGSDEQISDRMIDAADAVFFTVGTQFFVVDAGETGMIGNRQ